jgi:hypothetical protein
MVRMTGSRGAGVDAVDVDLMSAGRVGVDMGFSLSWMLREWVGWRDPAGAARAGRAL